MLWCATLIGSADVAILVATVAVSVASITTANPDSVCLINHFLSVGGGCC